MKKIIATFVAASMVICLIACGDTTDPVATEPTNEITNDTTTESSSAIDATTDTTSESTSETTTQEPTTTEAPTSTEGPTSTGEPESETETEEPTSIGSIDYVGPVKSEDLEDHGKELKLYGDTSSVDSAKIDELTELLTDYSKNISVAVWKKDGSLAMTYNSKQNFFSACTIKTGYILYCCRQIESGVGSLDTVMTYQSKHYHRGSGRIKYSDYGTEYTLGYLIQEALRISDNVAYEMLVDYFGISGYHKMLEEMDCTSLKVAPTIWSYDAIVTDYIVIWDAVYDYFQTGTEGAKIFYKSSLNTDFNYGTETLCDIVDYSHKSGDGFDAYAAYNDAGIVWDADSPYIYAIFSKSEGTSYDVKTVNAVAEVIYEIMTGKEFE